MSRETNQKAKQEANLYEPYDPNTLAYFKGKLLAERVKIMARLERNSNPILIEELNGFERIHRPQALAEHKTEEFRDKQNLADIEAALERIKNGSYGLCKGCQQRILLARLEAIPTAGSCVPCYAKKH